MISRVADICFWMCRYLERIENMSRMLNANHTFILDGSLRLDDAWWSVVCASGDHALFQVQHGNNHKEDIVQNFLVWDIENPNSMINSMQNARENARRIRDAISNEMWGVLNETWLWLISQDAKKMYQNNKYEFYEQVQKRCQLFQGTFYSTMPRNRPYDFMYLGMMLERADQTARILDINYHRGSHKETIYQETAEEIAHWINLLEYCAANEFFIACTQSDIVGVEVANFLIFNRSFPRTLYFSIHKAYATLNRIQSSSIKLMESKSLKILSAIVGWLNAKNIHDIFTQGLHEEITHMIDIISQVCQAIHEDYFSPKQPIHFTYQSKRVNQ